MSADAVAAVLDAIEALEPTENVAPLPKRFCFVEGTHVATLRGEMLVQNLRVGDHIRAKKGSFHTVSDVTVHAFDDLDPEAKAKIGLCLVLRGAIDEGLPRRDFYVSEGQQFELSRRLEIAHAVRMTVRKSGDGLRGFRFVVFACEGLPMIRAEGIWTTLTPMERAFPVTVEATAEEPADEGDDVDEATAPPPASRMESEASATARSTRRPLTRILSRPGSAPASHRTETGTPGQ